MIGILAAAAIAAASPASPPVSAPAAASRATNADPAIFVIRDADTTVYLFGTFHALDGKSEWFNDQVKTAFDQSNELVLETLIPDGPVKLPRSALTPGTMSVVPSASFLATTRMAIKAGRSQGMNVGNGADMVLRRAAEISGKQVEGLETFESQLNMFSKMAPAPAAP